MAKYVLVALAGETTRVQGGPYIADPGLAKLSKLTGLDESAVRRNLKVLVADGIVTKERTTDGKGHRTEDRYVLPVVVMASTASRAQWAESPVGGRPSGSTAQSQAATEPAESGAPSGRRAQGSTKEQDPSSKSPSDVVKSGPASRGTRLPDDWLRSDSDKAWQAEKGIPDDLAREWTAAFKDHFKAASGANATKRDWSAAWRNWMRREWRDEQRRGSRRSGAEVHDFAAIREQQRADAAARLEATNESWMRRGNR